MQNPVPLGEHWYSMRRVFRIAHASGDVMQPSRRTLIASTDSEQQVRRCHMSLFRGQAERRLAAGKSLLLPRRRSIHRATFLRLPCSIIRRRSDGLVHVNVEARLKMYWEGAGNLQGVIREERWPDLVWLVGPSALELEVPTPCDSKPRVTVLSSMRRRRSSCSPSEGSAVRGIICASG
ncbi:hypothetical protein PAXRUDRAFT_826242 [Paxillus rubicundulus Ve08.2h10]|uniref:Unplaced genomic scaffold scaffold_178, whole genome shotgun sequence n=1 Tax=Paxillus rubicundulus Ve08.2h10 TaxID=930991 RepID=A0A0D0DZQ9_9AGAM|nr:hypothetical protein PAXRUDRAFT_826242 [Paxillus rubicundulus Ve08.2h10]